MITNNITDAATVKPGSFPIIDMSDFGEPAGRKRVVDEIRKACTTIGFFLVTGHGIPRAVSDGLKQASEKYFAFPKEEKLLDATEPRFRRGFLSFSEESPLESYEFSLDLPLDDSDVIAGRFLHGPNHWPEKHPWLQDAADRYQEAVLEVGEQIERAFALSLDLDGEFFVDLCRKPTLHMRLFHYFPRTEEQRRTTFSSQPHTDLGMFTILMPDPNGGLQVQMRDETWVNVPYVDDALVVNIGDMMEIWTNDRYVSTPHRVVGLTGKDRYSVPVFICPAFETLVECIPSCLAAGEAPKHPPMRAGKYLEQRLGMEDHTEKTSDYGVRAHRKQQVA